MWRSNTQVHRNNKLYWEFKNDELSQASFLHLVSKNNKVFMSTQDISVISTDNISHPMYRRALILTSVTSTKTQEEPQTLFAYDSVWRLIWGAKKHARVYYSVWENWMCSTALHDIGGKHYRSRTRLRKNHKSRTATRRAEQTTREKAGRVCRDEEKNTKNWVSQGLKYSGSAQLSDETPAAVPAVNNARGLISTESRVSIKDIQSRCGGTVWVSHWKVFSKYS